MPQNRAPNCKTAARQSWIGHQRGSTSWTLTRGRHWTNLSIRMPILAIRRCRGRHTTILRLKCRTTKRLKLLLEKIEPSNKIVSSNSLPVTKEIEQTKLTIRDNCQTVMQTKIQNHQPRNAQIFKFHPCGPDHREDQPPDN